MSGSITDDRNQNKRTQSIENLKLEHDTLMEEYRIINAQILRRLEADGQGVNLVLVSIGVTIAVGSLAIQQAAYGLLLALTVPYYLLTWEQVRRATIADVTGQYIRNTLAPRINHLLRQTDVNLNQLVEPALLEVWEQYLLRSSREDRLLRWSIVMTQGGRAFTSLFIVGILIFAYFAFSFNSQPSVPALDILLLILNGVLASITIVLLLITAFRSAFLRR